MASCPKCGNPLYVCKKCRYLGCAKVNCKNQGFNGKGRGSKCIACEASGSDMKELFE